MRRPSWTTAVPLGALVLLALTWGGKPPAAVLVVVGVFLAGAVLAAVHHAEVVAHRVGEPFGSLVLAVAVTVIEVALIVTLMVSGDGDETATLARDTVFAAVMITCNGVLGLSVLVGALRARVATFNAEGTATALATVCTLATLSLVLPTYTTSRPGPEFSPAQLAFAAVASIALYVLFVIVQTVRHRDYFVPVGAEDDDEHAEPSTDREALASLALLARRARRRRRAGQDRVRADRGRGRRDRRTAVRRRRRDRAARPAPRDAGGRPQRAPGPRADELQPRPGLGDGQHRPHDPRDRGRLDLAGRPAHPRARRRPRLVLLVITADRGRADGAPRSRDAAGGRRAPRALRGLPVPGRQPLSTSDAGVHGRSPCVAPPPPAREGASRLRGDGDDDRDEDEQRDRAGDDHRRALARPEVRPRLVAGVPALGRRADPVVVVPGPAMGSGYPRRPATTTNQRPSCSVRGAAELGGEARPR